MFKKKVSLTELIIFIALGAFTLNALAGVVPDDRGEQPTGTRFQSDILGSDTILINATGNDTSSAFRLRQGQVKSLKYQLTSSAGTPDVAISYLLADAEDGIFVAPDNVDDLVSSVADENIHYKAFTPVVAGWAKIKFTGNAANANDTIVAELKLNEAAEY